MANVEEVKVNVAATVDGARQAVGGIRAVSDQLDEALARMRMTAVGSFHPAAVAAIAHLEQARARLDEAAQLTNAAIDSADQYRNVI
ncbi:hypothetical protein GCM10010112_44430 [Actinoplanes lobatus]|uniref:ElaB/YqjD/DUF883 family membrane-anchored ribosome-binding protein n=1 Tax=Actinoplanes lobatus TaxID=113568 RepID=A0A7W7HBJ5_9ACTN|nr:hypothetical protein [Actinoplanes lobatus]MBB4747520.1 ElaB/YqjD/DUF883 family membrane-anchored ribosome-binding protein [Actinoplanes lobatus]GGN74370.1 hypothetical protein GCM10010112_44430 [Actinoplanes lobatus]GIE39919.1 hypothetical protein Alo02nite_28170 [Actinoplanes lobatus]